MSHNYSLTTSVPPILLLCMCVDINQCGKGREIFVDRLWWLLLLTYALWSPNMTILSLYWARVAIHNEGMLFGAYQWLTIQNGEFPLFLSNTLIKSCCPKQYLMFWILGLFQLISIQPLFHTSCAGGYFCPTGCCRKA